MSVIVNRRAGRLAHDARIVEQCRARATAQVYETRSLDELDVAARAIASHARDTAIVLVGGDGSAMAGISALEKYFSGAPLPPVALVPAGTVSTVARNWGARGPADRFLARLLDGIDAGDAARTRRPTLAVEADGVRRVGFIAGAGLVARFFEAYDARGARGSADAARIVLRIFAGSFVGSAFARRVLDPSPCTIEVDGIAAPFDRVSLLCASVVRDLGIGMKLLYRAGERTDRFHVVATPQGATRLGPQMPLVLAGRPLVGPRVDTLAGNVRLRFPAGTGAYVLDGDLLRADTITIAAGPPIEVLTPSPTASRS